MTLVLDQPFYPHKYGTAADGRTVFRHEQIVQSDDFITYSMDRYAMNEYYGAQSRIENFHLTGMWEWDMKGAPEDGTIIGMFPRGYENNDLSGRPAEYDFEFWRTPAGDLRLHVEVQHHLASQPVYNDTTKYNAPGAPHFANISFDPGAAFHNYSISITDHDATWRIDGVVVAHFDEADMGHDWYLVPLGQNTNYWSPTYDYFGRPTFDHDEIIFSTMRYRPLEFTGTAAGEIIIGQPDMDIIKGLGGEDDLRGLGGNDDLRGGNGDDILRGGAGADRLTGGSGADTFRVDSSDVVTDFQQGVDILIFV